jgi:hypothetical protein
MTFFPKIHGPGIDDNETGVDLVSPFVDLADSAVEGLDLEPGEVDREIKFGAIPPDVTLCAHYVPLHSVRHWCPPFGAAPVPHAAFISGARG